MAGFSFGGDIESDAHECVKQFAAARGVQVEFPPIQHAGVFSENAIRYAREKQAVCNEKNRCSRYTAEFEDG